VFQYNGGAKVHAMKQGKRLLIVLVAAAVVAPLGAQVRLGVVGGVELWNRPTYAEVLDAFDNQANIAPGLYWEAIRGNFGYGMTGLVAFNRMDPATEGTDYDWYMDWIASFDLRYHFLRRFVLDPFVEMGVGSAGRVQLSGEDDPLNLSIFAQVGGGLAIRLRGVHLGTRVLYRMLNNPIPATDFEVYPLKAFHVDLFGGISL
jgi:hypothetical protein